MIDKSRIESWKKAINITEQEAIKYIENIIEAEDAPDVDDVEENAFQEMLDSYGYENVDWDKVDEVSEEEKEVISEGEKLRDSEVSHLYRCFNWGAVEDNSNDEIPF